MPSDTPLSPHVLLEVLRHFVIADALPSPRALEELAQASGKTIQIVKDYYLMTYEAAGNHGDPWSSVLPAPSDQS